MVVQCTWKPSEGRDIGDAVSWTSDETLTNDVEEEVQAENCLLLIAPYDGSSEYLPAPACQLLVSCHPTEQIKYISILSDARVMEVYGHHGEYLKTIRNELLEEVEDMAVFKGDVKLDRPLNVCSIKFACLRSKNEMWLYGVKVGIDKAPNQGNGHQISYAEVEQRLGEMGLSLSENAQAFKELVEARHPNFTGLTGQDIGALFNLFKLSNTNRELTATATVTDNNGMASNGIDNSITNNSMASNGIDNSITNNGTDHNTAEHSPTPTNANGEIYSDSNANVETMDHNNPVVALCHSESQTIDPPPPNFEDVIKPFIEKKLENLEIQLWEKVEKRFQEMEAKVLCKLDEIESFVKPQGV